jgi:dTDP-4-dehydrorhamnose reductase
MTAAPSPMSILISTDCVFDGCRCEPYREEDPVAPLDVCGRSTAEVEETVDRLLGAQRLGRPISYLSICFIKI